MLTLENTLSKRGSIEHLPGIRDKLKAIADGKINKSGVEGLYAGISDQMGDRVSEHQLMVAAKTGVRGITAGMSEESAATLGKNMGELLSQSGKGSLARMNHEQLEEVAYTLQKRIPGGVGDQQWRAIGRSKDPVQALDLVMTAAGGHESMKALESLMSEAEHEYSPEEIRKIRREMAHNPDARRQLRLTEIPTSDRYEQMLADPSLQNPEHARMIHNLIANQGHFVQQALDNRPLAGQAKAYARLLTTDPAVAASHASRMAAIKADQLAHNNEVEAAHQEAVWQQYENNLTQKGYSVPWVRSALTGAARLMHYNGLDERLGTKGETAYDNAEQWLDVNMKAERAKLAAEEFQHRKNFGSSANKTPNDMLQALLNATLKSHNLLDEQLSMYRTSRHTSLKTDHPGQQ